MTAAYYKNQVRYGKAVSYGKNQRYCRQNRYGKPSNIACNVSTYSNGVTNFTIDFVADEPATGDIYKGANLIGNRDATTLVFTASVSYPDALLISDRYLMDGACVTVPSGSTLDALDFSLAQNSQYTPLI